MASPPGAGTLHSWSVKKKVGSSEQLADDATDEARSFSRAQALALPKHDRWKIAGHPVHRRGETGA
jgi:hypothetical protein